MDHVSTMCTDYSNNTEENNSDGRVREKIVHVDKLKLKNRLAVEPPVTVE